jgi:hypothetical protein
MRRYTVHDLESLGLSTTTVDRWQAQGLIAPVVRQGKRRLYSERTAFAAFIGAQLLAAGAKTVAKCLRWAQDPRTDVEASIRSGDKLLVANARQLFLAREGAAFAAPDGAAVAVLVVDLEQALKAFRAAPCRGAETKAEASRPWDAPALSGAGRS